MTSVNQTLLPRRKDFEDTASFREARDQHFADLIPRGPAERVVSNKVVVDRVVSQPPKVIEKVVEKIVEVPVEVVREVENTDRLDELESRLKAAQEALERRPETVAPDPDPVPDLPPEAIADLFQADRPFADQAKALWNRYNELTQKIMLKIATDSEREKHTKLQGELDWIKRHAFEGI
ncbi:MAG: hypothetical protein AAFZ74_02175 [Pseudomonadota bacterium]